MPFPIATVDKSGSGDCSSIPNKLGKKVNLQISDKLDDDGKVTLLYSAWTAMLDESKNGEAEVVNVSSIPNAPHLENCELITQVNQRLDSRSENGSFPPWTIWKGLLGEQLLQPTLVTDGELMNSWNQENSGKAYPPWVCVLPSLSLTSHLIGLTLLCLLFFSLLFRAKFCLSYHWYIYIVITSLKICLRFDFKI